MRYEEITSTEDIYAGAEGHVKTADDVANFLEGWSQWLAEIISTIKNFFDQLMASFSK